MNHLFSINAEGGPLLLIDAIAVAQWDGAENGGENYQRLSAMFDVSPNIQGLLFDVKCNLALAWEMSGAGTADVFGDASGVVRIVRAWLSEDTAEELENLALAVSQSSVSIGEIYVPSGRLAVFWAPESGKFITNSGAEEFRMVKGTVLAQSAFVMKVTSKKYECLHDEVKVGMSQARRLTLRPCD